MIITPQQLWKDYDRKKAPLAKSLVKEIVLENKTIVRYFYFNGDFCGNVCARIYAKLYLPAVCKGEKAIIVMDDLKDGVDSFNPEDFLSRGWACLVVDYAGISPTLSRYTIYPTSLSFANYFENPNCLTTFPEIVTNSCRYVWATLAMRSVTFLESENFTEIAFLGVGEGGAQAYKISYFCGLVKAAAVLFSDTTIVSPQNEHAPDNNYLAFKASLDNSSYSPYLKVPFFMQVTSNEQNSSLDRLSELYDSAEENGALLAISPRTDRTIEISQRKNIAIFFASAFSGMPFVTPPSIIGKASDKSLYFDIVADSKYDIESLTLYVARGNIQPSYRNWQTVNLEKIGGNNYLTKIKVFNVSEPVYAFVVVKYVYGFVLSSSMLKINPKIMGIEESPFVRKRIIYDIDMGTSSFMMLSSLAANDGELSMQKGAFDISGITSSSNSLATFMLSDSQYKGASDSVLQIILYSIDEQIITMSISSNQTKSKFICQKSVTPNDDWTKFALSLNDFRSSEGPLSSWDEVVTFAFSGTGKFLINSMLWV